MSDRPEASIPDLALPMRRPDAETVAYVLGRIKTARTALPAGNERTDLVLMQAAETIRLMRDALHSGGPS